MPPKKIKGKDNLSILKALASETRLKIIELLGNGPLNVNEIANRLNIPQPGITMHIQKLEKVGLVTSEYKVASQGLQKVCARNYDNILVEFTVSKEVPPSNTVEVYMPVGLYKNCEVYPTCGIVSDRQIIGLLDSPNSFFEPEHVFAQLLWFSRGFVEYAFPNNIPPGCEATGIEIVLEMCSEAPDYNNDYPSDITLFVNGVEIGTWTCPGDFGGKKGEITPSWWPERYTQFGVLKHWSIDKKGAFIDGVRLSDKKIADICMGNNGPIIVRFEVKKDAKNVGGINLFGRKFGNYGQDVLLKIEYELRGSK
ncbi:metalloregulator ArsR/SmtB family transcription factor [candidate division WOR-3 bacterium]|nr:metalloregulator ArsR/SmtB family transcription factor [candidate division WOR-3 bacterium]